MITENNDILFGNGDELPSNHSTNPHIQDVISLGRRKVLAGGAAMGALAFLGASFPASRKRRSQCPAGSKMFRSNVVPACRSCRWPLPVPTP